MNAMSYDSWKTRSPDDGQPQVAKCHRCNASLGCLESECDENEYGEFICAECEESAAERACDRHQESLMSGDTPTFRETYLAAYEQKRALK